MPTPATYSTQSPKTLAEDAKVKELLDQDTRWWNSSLIKEIFQEDEVDIICQLSLSKYSQKNVMIWKGTSTG